MKLDQDVLRRVQMKQLDILLEVKRICDKHQICYQLYGGTLLGAVRHKGFIPWDDDIDITMFREDYEHFLRVAPNEISEDFYVESARNTPDYVYSFCKVKANNTVYVEECTSELNIHQGIWIDIFPLDDIQKIDYDVLDKRVWQIGFWQTAVDYNAGIIRLPKVTSAILFKLVGILNKHKLMFRKEQKMREANSDAGKYAIDYCSDYGYKKGIFPIEIYRDLIELEFEGHLFSAPRNYHYVLELMYGDYMQLPPVEKRVNGHGIIRCEV